ncbi:hypothetical protein FZZ93_08715 [Halomonas eurihalina]|uniref:DUF4412 domain-containing protein n=1 Tax=Halomonas eurihalina TaxID=42566 RepID=A0A5D9D8W1_HALER|nr:hypothetical protein [Halomonas eurihalina]MDR5859975.1 hypothetical protein [Halomonas eurihalina]TZG39843.1 hypothetical protein FZZ93_08715 [Halomonas eurihalina]
MRHLATGLLATGLVMAAASPAMADGQATLEAQSDQGNVTMNVRWAGENLLRMDFPDQSQTGFMLLRDGKGYLVSQVQGQTMVMDMAKLKGMAENMGGGEIETLAGQQASQVDALEATGDSESIAGLEGDVYRLQWTDKNGTAHDDELVLSDDPQVLELMSAFHDYQRSMTGESDPIATTLEERGLGMLRFGDRFRLAELNDASPAPEIFELPEDAKTFEDMMRSAISE